MSFRRVLLVLLAVTWSAGPGCASDEAARVDAARKTREGRASPIPEAKYEDDNPSSKMAVKGDEGTLVATEVESAIQRHLPDFRECYLLGKRAPQRGNGRVLLRFFVDAKGEVEDVALLESNLGNGRVERCLADIAVGVVFQPPAGRKPTTFEYPLEFRPARLVRR